MFVSYRMEAHSEATWARINNGIKETTEENIRAWENLRRRFDGIEDNVNELRDDVNTLQTDMTNVKNNVNGLAIRTDNLRNNVNDIQTRTTNLERNVNRVEDTTDKNTEKINNIKVRQEEEKNQREKMENFLQERFHYGMKKVNELSSSTSSASSEIPLQEIEGELSETL